jgi:hypothetical protein
MATFHDLDDPDRFVWFRGFKDMAARKAALTEFYEHSEAWRTHGPSANATMIDSSNVLLLRPLTPWIMPTTNIAVNVHPRGHVVDDEHTWLETGPSPNNYPRLPVRDENVVVSIGNRGKLRLAPIA